MGLFDDDDESGSGTDTVSADPGALEPAWDSVANTVTEYAEGAEEQAAQVGNDVWQSASDFADKAATDFEADPVGFVSTATGNPEVTIDTDSSDGNLAFKYKSAIADIDGKWEEGKGSTVHGQVGADLGPAPLFKSDVATDADGNVTKVTTEAKVTVPIEGVNVTAEAKAGYEQTADGYKASFSNTGGADISGFNVKGGTHAGYEDKGEHGYNITAGPHGGVGVGAGEIADGFDAAEGELKSSLDFSYGELDGQTTAGARLTNELEGKVLGQSLGSVKTEAGVAYTTGPNGEQVIVDQRFSGTLGNEQLGQVSGSSGASWAVGVDGEGNEVDRVTVTNESSITEPGQQPVTTTSTSVFDDATGIHDFLGVDQPSDDPDAITAPAPQPSDIPLDAIDPDFIPDIAPAPQPTDIPLDAIDPDFIPDIAPAPQPSNIPLDAIDPDFIPDQVPDIAPEPSVLVVPGPTPTPVPVPVIDAPVFHETTVVQQATVVQQETFQPVDEPVAVAAEVVVEQPSVDVTESQDFGESVDTLEEWGESVENWGDSLFEG